MKSLEQHIHERLNITNNVISERLVLSKDKRNSIFDNIQPISNPSGDMLELLYDSLDAWIYRDKEDERYDLLRVYESEDELPLFNAAYYVSGLNINKQEYTIMLECTHINIGGIVGVSKLPLSRIATILGNNDKEKGYGVIDYIIKDIDM